MFSYVSGNIYESEDIRSITGDTIRPGGFKLTDRAVEFCDFKKDYKILDIGCGMGATVAYLQDKYALDALGIDPSDKLLLYGKNKNSKLNIYKGIGEALFFEDDEMDGVFCECTLSLMNDKYKVISEIHRVLKNRGYVIISDVYAKNPNYIKELEKFGMGSCIRGVHDIEDLKEKLRENGFRINFFEDYTNYLKQMIVDIIFQFGSIDVFWRKAGKCNSVPDKFKKVLSRSKIGYFLLIAQKTGKDD